MNLENGFCYSLNSKCMDSHITLTAGFRQHEGLESCHMVAQSMSAPFLQERHNVQHILNPVYNAVTGHLFYYETFLTCKEDAGKQ